MPYRIALVTHALDGGVWSLTHFLLDILRGRRYEVDLILLATSARDAASIRLLAPTTWRRGPQILNIHKEGFAYRHVGAMFCELEFQRYRPRRVLTDLLNRYDLVQVAAGGPVWGFVTQDVKKPVALQIATLARAERGSCVTRNWGVFGIWRWFMTKAITVLEQRALHSVDVVFVMNRWIHEFLCQEIGPKNAIFAPPGIDTDYWRPATYQPNGHILSVSRLSDPRKNVRMLMRAYQRLRQASPQVPKLVLAGNTGLLHQDWAYAASLGLIDHIEVHVGVSSEKLRALYQNASLFVLSSDEEGLGIVILEAMACSLPVVSTDCGGPSTSVLEGETGFLTPVGDVQTLAETMRCVLEDSELRQRIGQAGRQRAEERFSIEAAGRPYLEKYDELLG